MVNGSETRAESTRSTSRRPQSTKATCSTENEMLSCKLIHEEYLAGNLLGTTFTNASWNTLFTKLSNQNQRKYQFCVDQMKGKYCRLKAQWRHIKDVCEQTGFGWDEDNQVILATKELDTASYGASKNYFGLQKATSSL